MKRGSILLWKDEAPADRNRVVGLVKGRIDHQQGLLHLKLKSACPAENKTLQGS